MPKRKYEKKNLSYWNKTQPVQQANSQVVKHPDLDMGFDENDHYTSVAACGGGSPTHYRGSQAPTLTQLDKYPNINSGILPWEESNGYTSISSTILLCQRAYANVAIIRNTIESAVEFSNSNLHIKTSNETVKAFFTEWFNRINIYKLKDMFFREYYRSGNVFMYKFNGKLTPEKYGIMKSVFGARSDVLPIRYIILNPSQIYLNAGLGVNGNWAKLLSTYEIEMLKLRRTEEDQQIYNSLPADIKNLINNGSGYNSIYMPLDPKRLYYAFYKKQDYEALAIPMVFPVLNDIEWKLELKKLDMAVARQMEQAILLVTNGEETKPGGLGGVNPENIRKLREIFKNKTLGRVLVADYTTKAQWVNPDIAAVLGPEKYKQVEMDIKEGLQSILTGGEGDKFANSQTKAKVFIERMKEGQKVFLNNFLLPEIKLICQQMNFKNVPEIEFEEINLDDQTNLDRLYVRLAELGILTAPEVIQAINTGVLPDNESNIVNQQEYKKLRDKDLYVPLLGGPKEEEGRPGGTKSPQTTKKVSPIGTKASEEVKFSAKTLTELSIKADKLKDKMILAAKKKHKIAGDLNEAQISVVETLAKNIIANEPVDKWESSVASYLKSPKEIDADIAREMNDIAARYDTTDWDAALLVKSKL